MSEDSRPPRPTAIELVRLDDALSEERIRGFAQRLSGVLAVPVRLSTARTAEAVLLPGRTQTDADALLAMLEARAAPPTLSLGLTTQDLAIPIFTFVFGRARTRGRAAVVSLARLDSAFYGLPPDEDQLLRRGVNEALHELGHLAGLPHCDLAECVMRFAGSVEKADVRGSRFCAACACRLPEGLLHS